MGSLFYSFDVFKIYPSSFHSTPSIRIGALYVWISSTFIEWVDQLVPLNLKEGNCGWWIRRLYCLYSTIFKTLSFSLNFSPRGSEINSLKFMKVNRNIVKIMKPMETL